MLQPYQCLVTCGKVLVAASISYLDSFNIEDGSLISRWSYSTQSRRNCSQETVPEIQQFRAPEITPESGSPSKRRRSSTPGDEGDFSDRKSKRNASNEIKTAKSTPAIIALASTRDAKHIIAVTGEDKAIRVFEHDGKGILQQVSQRTMPKRPCALVVATDDSTIICADKFGDVYSLPLLCDSSHKNEEVHEGLPKANVAAESQSKPFIPAANNLTVHSVRNLRALRSQMKQTQKAPGKPELDFERKLLLGHVSMLTDIAVVEREGRSYIVTADRDEHIRISRGIPQTHVIERYCLGHKEFVSRLCFPGSRQNVLISGGGDDDIYVWDWYLGVLIQSVNLRKHVENFLSKTAQVAGENGEFDNINGAQLEGKIAVLNIIYLGRNSNEIDYTIIVTCEGIPALFVFALFEDSSLCYSSTLPLEGNPLNVVASTATKNIIVSIDTIHKPGSTTQPRSMQDNRTQISQLQTFEMTDSGLASTLQFEAAYKTPGDNEPDTLNVSSILYSIANLRKRGGEE